MLFVYIYSHDIIYIVLEVKATILFIKKKKKTISEFRSKQIFFHICLNPMPESSERDRPKLPKVKANLFPHYLSFILYHPSLLTSDL